jgi:soluble P-type ATPase
MLNVRVPGLGTLRITHLVLDYNGTLAIDGRPLRGVKTRLKRLARSLRVHVVTADTFGRAQAELSDVECELQILRPGREDRAKARYVRRLGSSRVACVGNGRNDRSMLRVARLGVAVVQAEGAAAEALAAADVIVHSINDALDLFLHPRRLIASLRA